MLLTHLPLLIGCLESGSSMGKGKGCRGEQERRQRTAAASLRDSLMRVKVGSHVRNADVLAVWGCKLLAGVQRGGHMGLTEPVRRAVMASVKGWYCAG